MASSAAPQEPSAEMRRMMLAKDESARGLQSSLEAERRQRRQLQAEASAERVTLQERYRQTEADLQQQLQEQKADMEERREELHTENARLAEQHRNARCREAELLVKNGNLADDLRRLLARSEADAAELLALRARVEALSADLTEAQGALRLSDEVRSGMAREAKDQTASLETLRVELRELHLLERAGREQAQAQHERLSGQCESMARQAQDRGREALVLEERCQRLEENLRARGIESERALSEADERRREAETRLAKSEEEATTLRDELRGKALVESKLKEAITGHEAQLEDHKKEEQRLRQEVFRHQATSDEKDLSLQAGKNREQQLAAAQATVEERLRITSKESEERQTALFAARDRNQTLELELQGARDTASSLREEITRVRASEESHRLEDTRRLDEKVAQREAEIALLQRHVSEHREKHTEHRGELERGSVDLAMVRGELAVAVASREAEVRSRDEAAARAQAELVAARDARDEIDAVLANVRRDLESARADAARTQSALAEARAVAEASQTRAEALEERVLSWRPPSLSEEGVQTTPRILPAARSPWLPEGQVWGSEMAALHRSVESLQAMVNVPPTSLPLPPEEGGLPFTMPTGIPFHSSGSYGYGPGMSYPSVPSPRHVADIGRDSTRESVCAYMDRHLQRLHRHVLISGAWQSWRSHCHTARMRAQLDMAMADDQKVAREGETRAEVCADVLASELAEPTVAALKQLLLEFRQRLVAALTDMHPATSAETRALLVDSMDRGRRSYGRIFHAALFLYQKLRAFVPSELQESLKDPLSKLAPFPFYVLPYKAQQALHQGLTGLVPGAAKRSRARSSSPAPCGKAAGPCDGDADAREEWFRKHICELEERLPLASSSKVEVPHFLARLLQCRALANAGEMEADQLEEEAPFRDRFDVLLADAFTVYMSAWRSAGSSVPGDRSTAQATVKPSWNSAHATVSPYLVGAATPTRASTPNVKLRLGVKGRGM